MDAVKEIKLGLRVTGASEEALQRGIAAAKEVFKTLHVSPVVACRAAALQDLEDTDLNLTEEEWLLGDIWRTAEHTAIDACCEGSADGFRIESEDGLFLVE